MKITMAICILCLAMPVRANKVWIDADTGNEMDDVYAIARILLAPSVDVVGVSSAHFNNADLVAFETWNQYPTAGIKTVAISQELNEKLLLAMGKAAIPAYLGADRQMGRAWGGVTPRPSAATAALIREVAALPAGEKLDILTLGALTNIASAVAIDPGIAQRIRCFTLGAGFRLDGGVWNKNEFNIRNDLNAFDFLLDSQVEITIMSIDVARSLRADRDDSYAKLAGGNALHRNLRARWEQTNPLDTSRILWDVALVQAYLRPDLTSIKSVSTPPENRQRMVKVFTHIDSQAMADDFWRAILADASTR